MRIAPLLCARALAVGIALAAVAGPTSAAAQQTAAADAPAPSCLGKARLRGQTFASGGATILDEAKVVLDLIATAIKERCAGKKITIEGHTDTNGSAEANLALSERRAAAVREYLVAQGVPADQLHVIGYGESRPISETDHELNRRVTFLVEG